MGLWTVTRLSALWSAFRNLELSAYVFDSDRLFGSQRSATIPRVGIISDDSTVRVEGTWQGGYKHPHTLLNMRLKDCIIVFIVVNCYKYLRTKTFMISTATIPSIVVSSTSFNHTLSCFRRRPLPPTTRPRTASTLEVYLCSSYQRLLTRTRLSWHPQEHHSWS